MSDYKITPLKTAKSKIKSRKHFDNHICIKPPCSVVISGASGSGKTQLLLNLLTKKQFYGGYFDMIFVFSNTAEEGDDLYKHLDLDDENFFKPNAEGLNQIKHIIRTQKSVIKEDGIENSPSILLIFDDMANERKFLASDEYLKLHIMNRHYNISVFSLYQSYMKAPRSCRIQISGLCYFKGKKTESSRISDEHCPPNYTEKEFSQLVDYATKDPFSFLYINYKAPGPERYRKNFDEIMELTK
jgi:hypothetical protein